MPSGRRATNPFERLVDEVLAGGRAQPVWGQHGHHRYGGFNERRFAKQLRAYWGADADSMRVRLATEDARFAAGVVQLVGDELHLDAGDRRRVAVAVVRWRVLGEPDPTLTEVDAAWRAWWPPPPGADGTVLLRDFLGAWRDWLSPRA